MQGHALIQKQKQLLEKGQGLVEYALILVLVAVVVIVILAVLGPTIRITFDKALAGIQCSHYMDEFNTDQTNGTIPPEAFMLVDATDCFAATGGPNQSDIIVEQMYGPFA
jgi:pilus assembly protein Flp/PilA